MRHGDRAAWRSCSSSGDFVAETAGMGKGWKPWAVHRNQGRAGMRWRGDARAQRHVAMALASRHGHWLMRWKKNAVERAQSVSGRNRRKRIGMSGLNRDGPINSERLR